MPNMVQKHTWVYQGGQGEEWTEVYTMNGSSDLDAQLAAIPATLINARLIFLANCYFLRSIRASYVGLTKGSKFRLINLPGTGGSDELSQFSPETSGICSVYNINCTPSGRRFLFVSGLPDTNVFRSAVGRDLPSPVMDPLIKEFVRAAGEYGYGVQAVKRRDPALNLDYQDCHSVDGATQPGWTWLIIDTPGNFQKNDIVNLSKFNEKDLPGINTFFLVKAISANSIAIQYSTPSHRAVGDQFGRVRKIEFHPVARFKSDGAEFSHHSGRQRRRSFTGSRGAAHASRTRNLD